MLDSSAGVRLASAWSDLALLGLRTQMSLLAIGPEIALRSLRRPEPPAFAAFMPAVWPSPRRALPPTMQLSLAFWQGWFRYADAMRETAPVWPAFTNGAAGSGHAGQMIGESPRVHVAYQPGVHSPFWPWAGPGMLLFAVTVPPALEAMMAGWGRMALAA
jgi:hypothetical protein